MKRLLIVVISVFLLAGCDEGGAPMQTGDSYLPLEVGNSWKFVSINAQSPSDYTFKRVVGEVRIEGDTWFEIVSGYANPQEKVTDTSYYRIDTEGHVFIRRKHDDFAENRFRLKGTDGDSWTYDIGGIVAGEATIYLSELSLKVGFTNLQCKAYYRDITPWVDEEHTITLGKGVGFVKEYSDAWGMGSIVSEAVIGGRTRTFR